MLLSIKQLINNDDIQVYNYLKNNGGGTYDTNGVPVTYSDGYQVSYTDERLPFTRVGMPLIKALFISMLKSAQVNNDNVGYWVDNGFIYIDLSHHIEFHNTAVSRGKIFKQQSIYDWRNSTTIKL